MSGGLLSGLGKVINAGAAYVQHVNFAQRALSCPSPEMPALMAGYLRDLSDASFTGFKMTLTMLIAKEGDAARKAGLQRLLQLSDPARRGEVVASVPPAVPASAAESGFDRDVAWMSHWYDEKDEEQRKAALIEHILSLSPDGY